MTAKQFGRNGFGPARRAYTAEARATLIRKVRHLVGSEGLTVAAAAARLDLNVTTLYKWLRQDEVGGFRSVALVADELAVVSAVSVPPACRAVLTSPGGYRVDGLDLEGVAELLRRLS